MKFKHNYGSELLNSAYEKFFKGEYITYEEFVIMLSTNDELYFSQSLCLSRIIGQTNYYDYNQSVNSLWFPATRSIDMLPYIPI